MKTTGWIQGGCAITHISVAAIASLAACVGNIGLIDPGGESAASGDASGGASGVGGAPTGSGATGGDTSAATATAATGSTGTTGSGGAGTDACAHRAEARCERLSTCTDGAQIALRFGDLATCIDRLTLMCLGDLLAPDTSTTIEALHTCATAFSEQGCQAFLNGDTPPECGIDPGGRAKGDLCLSSTQCKSTFCLLAKDEVCGICAPTPTVGSPCQTTIECGPDLFCTKVVSSCAKLLPVGAACDGGFPCEANLSCVGAGPGQMGTCVPAAASVGDACDVQTQTAPACDRQRALFCDAATSKCAQTTYVAPGGACGALPGGGQGACAAGGLCVSGACVGPAADEGTCDPTSGPPCMAPAKCVGTAPLIPGACLLAGPSTCP